MGRHKTYDRENVTRKAMDLFWTRGFHATSTQDLAEQMEINRYSLFAEFGSKQGLFETSLAMYERDIVSSHFAALESKEAGLADIQAVLDAFAAAAGGPGSERGCMLCNVAAERAPFDPASERMVAGYVDRIQRAIVNALENARQRGEVDPDVAIEDQARLLTTSLLGFWLLMRAGVEAELLRGAARAWRVQLDRLRSVVAREGAALPERK
jgi:TetR/AcrR family transcriptional regulator, transcriptional repressor for nem operon